MKILKLDKLHQFFCISYVLFSGAFCFAASIAESGHPVSDGGVFDGGEEFVCGGADGGGSGCDVVPRFLSGDHLTESGEHDGECGAKLGGAEAEGALFCLAFVGDAPAPGDDEGEDSGKECGEYACDDACDDGGPVDHDRCFSFFCGFLGGYFGTLAAFAVYLICSCRFLSSEK